MKTITGAQLRRFSERNVDPLGWDDIPEYDKEHWNVAAAKINNYFANQSESCPFCEETGFDLIGLKSHLNGNCKIFNDTERESKKGNKITKRVNKGNKIIEKKVVYSEVEKMLRNIKKNINTNSYYSQLLSS